MPKYTEAEAAAYYNSRPKKATGACVLIFNKKGDLLIVKPNYLDRWLWIGGGIEDNETPKAAATRECREEIGVVPPGLRLAFVHYLSPKPNGQAEVIHFTFTTNPVDDDFMQRVKIDTTEIDDAKFVPVAQLPSYTSEKRANAVKAYVANPSTTYIEDGVA